MFVLEAKQNHSICLKKVLVCSSNTLILQLQMLISIFFFYPYKSHVNNDRNITTIRLILTFNIVGIGSTDILLFYVKQMKPALLLSTYSNDLKISPFSLFGVSMILGDFFESFNLPFVSQHAWIMAL